MVLLRNFLFQIENENVSSFDSRFIIKSNIRFYPTDLKYEREQTVSASYDKAAVIKTTDIHV